MRTIEYRVRTVTRYIVTRWEQGEKHDNGGMFCGSCSFGEFYHEQSAQKVAHALGAAEEAAASPGESVTYPPPPGW